jgi:hypothetical protein
MTERQIDTDHKKADGLISCITAEGGDRRKGGERADRPRNLNRKMRR